MKRMPVCAVTWKPADSSRRWSVAGRERLLHPVAVESHAVQHVDQQRPEERIELVRDADDRDAAGLRIRKISRTAWSYSGKCSIVPIE